MRRLILIASAAAAALAATAAVAAEKTMTAGKAFPYLENYLKMPAATRSRFTLAYYATIGGKPVTDVKVWLVDGGKRTPLPVGAEGAILHTPNLGQLEHDATVVIDAPPDTKIGPAIEPLVTRSTEMDAQALTLAAQQADVAVRKAMGALGFAAPHLTRIYFKGGVGAEAVFADGHAVKLGEMKSFAFYDIDADHGAKTVRFSKAPTVAIIGPAGK